MPRPIFQSGSRNQSGRELSLNQGPRTRAQDPMVMQRTLRKKRSRAYLDAIRGLDAGGHVHNHEKAERIRQAIRDEFPEIELTGVLLGFVSKCYLGDPYEVHIVDMTGSIVEHYERGKMLPGGLERARGLAASGAYDVIEVYVDCMRAISPDGSVSVISG